MDTRSTFPISRPLAAFAAVVFSAAAFAHTPLKSSSPAADSTVAGVSVIEIEFNGPVRLVRLRVTQGEVEIPTEFAPNPEPLASFEIAAGNIPAGLVTVGWAAIGADGHTLTDTFSFTVEPGIAGVAGN